MSTTRKRQFTPAQDAKIISMRDAGKTWRQIGDEFRICKETAIQRGRELGLLGVRNIQTSDSRRTPAELAKLRQLWDEGLSVAKIASAMGRGWTPGAVHGLTTRQKFPPRCNPAFRVIAASSPQPAGAVDVRLPMPAGSAVSWGAISDQPWPGDLP